jgi:hypothetical protein
MATAIKVERGAPPENASSALLAVLERCWAKVRQHHPELPEAVLIVASGSGPKGGVEKWGHFAPHRWEHGDQERHEVLIGAEGLRRGADEVLETLLHEAAHGLAASREVADTSRQGRYHNRHYQRLAQELGLIVEKVGVYGWTGTTLSEQARKRYAPQLRQLERALVLWRREEPAGGRGGATAQRHRLLLCSCEPPRKIRAARATAELGPILCGVCDEEFRAEESEEDENDG